MKQKKILFIVFGLPYGGTTVSLLNIINYLSSHKNYRIEVLTFWNESNYFVEQIQKKARIINVSLNSKRIDKLPFGVRGIVRVINTYWWNKFIVKPKRFMKVYNFFVADKYDYEVGYTETNDVLDFLKYRKSNSKKYQWIHTDIFRNNETKGIEIKLEELKVVDSYFCVSKSIQKDLQKKFPHKQIKLQYNQFDEKELKQKSQAYDVFFENNQYPHFICVGRISEIKGYDRLIKIHHKLIQMGLYHYIHIIGDDQGYKSEIKHLISKLGVESTVIFHGGMSNPYPYFIKSQGLIISSYSEGLPTVAIEAQILKCPIISTDVGGIREINTPNSGVLMGNSEQEMLEGLAVFIRKINLKMQFKFDSRKFTSLNEIEKIFE